MNNSLSTDKQKLLIEYMISSPDIFAIVHNIVDHKFFDPEFRNGIKFFKKYYEQYKNIPDVDIINGESGILYEKKSDLTNDKIAYTINEIEKFCQLENFRLELLRAADKMMSGGSLDSIRDNFVKNTDIGIVKTLGVSVFDDAEQLLENLDTDIPISTGWKNLDDAIGKGLYRQTLTIFGALSGIGKSNLLCNLSVNFAKQGLNVLYITLELNTTMVFSRMNANLTDINPNNLDNRSTEALIKLRNLKKTHGNIILEYFPSGSSVNDFRPFIKECALKHEKPFHAILIDYLGEMSPNDKSISQTDIATRDRAIASELRSLGVEFNVPVISAAQLSKGSEDTKELSQSTLSGGKYLSNLADNLIFIICDGVMVQQGLFDLQIIKNRISTGRGKIINMLWNSNSMRISEPTENDIDRIKNHTKKSDDVYNAKNNARNKLMSMVDKT